MGNRTERTTFLETLIERAIWVCGVSAIVFVGLIFLFLIQEGAPAFLDVPLANLSAERWYPVEGYFGLWPLILGTLMVTVGAAIIALPQDPNSAPCRD